MTVSAVTRYRIVNPSKRIREVDPAEAGAAVAICLAFRALWLHAQSDSPFAPAELLAACEPENVRREFLKALDGSIVEFTDGSPSVRGLRPGDYACSQHLSQLHRHVSGGDCSWMAHYSALSEYSSAGPEWTPVGEEVPY